MGRDRACTLTVLITLGLLASVAHATAASTDPNSPEGFTLETVLAERGLSEFAEVLAQAGAANLVDLSYFTVEDLEGFGPSHPRPFHACFSSQFPGTCLGVSSKSGALNGGCSPRLVCKAHAAAV